MRPTVERGMSLAAKARAMQAAGYSSVKVVDAKECPHPGNGGHVCVNDCVLRSARKRWRR